VWTTWFVSMKPSTRLLPNQFAIFLWKKRRDGSFGGPRRAPGPTSPQSSPSGVQQVRYVEAVLGLNGQGLAQRSPTTIATLSQSRTESLLVGEMCSSPTAKHKHTWESWGSRIELTVRV
jgi:hypothetical protein